MNERVHLAADVRVAAAAIDLIRAAGIDEADSDFAALVETECDALERLRRMLRAARVAEADAKATGDVINELRERKTRLESKSEQLRGTVLWALEELGMTKLEAPDMTVSVRPGRPGVEVTDLSKIPDRFVRVKIEPDKAAIRDALEQGEQIEGVTLKNARPSLTIRSR